MAAFLQLCCRDKGRVPVLFTLVQLFMALILNIDTAGKVGIVSLARDGELLESRKNSNPMEHGAFLQPAIAELLQTTGISLQDIQAVAVSNGPGSYTGLRVGLASAKGLCFALQVPLITLSTLQMMALAANQVYNPQAQTGKMAEQVLFCPMIDARRMEVFFGLYQQDMQIRSEPGPVVLDAGFLQEELMNGPIVFSGSGAPKWQAICTHPNALFLDDPDTSPAMAFLSRDAYQKSAFADLARSEPFYTKAFYNTASTKA